MKGDSGPDRTLRLSAVCGIGVPIIFTAVTASVSFLRPGYNHLSQFVSELGESGAPYSTLQNAAFTLYGLLVIVFSVGLSKGIGASRASRIGAVLLVVSGVGDVGAAIFPCDLGCPSSGSTSNILHGQFSILGIVAAILAIWIFSLALGKDSRWRGYRAYSLATAVLATIFYLLAGFIGPQSLRGGFQRLRLGTMLLWIGVMGAKLLSLSVRPISIVTPSSKARGIEGAAQSSNPVRLPFPGPSSWKMLQARSYCLWSVSGHCSSFV